MLKKKEAKSRPAMLDEEREGKVGGGEVAGKGRPEGGVIAPFLLGCMRQTDTDRLAKLAGLILSGVL